MLVYRPNDSAAVRNRAEMTLSRLGETWRRAPNGGRFIVALSTFLSALKPHTYRSYQFALLEFYDWCEAETGSAPTPHDVRRELAGKYVAWLKSRRTGVLELRLHKDPARMLERAIYDYVKQRPGAHIAEIAQTLNAYDALKADTQAADGSPTRVLAIELEPGGLDRYLACLVERKILTRTPTLEQLRRLDEQEERKLGNKSGRWTRALGQRVFDPNVFAYSSPKMTAPGARRSGSVQTRIAALSSFWQFMIDRSGENTGEAGLIEHNIWLPYLKQETPVAQSHAKASRVARTPDETLWQRLLATTLHDDGTPKQTFEDLRDKAVLMALYHLALRADEIGTLKREHMSGDVPPLLTVTGKRDQTRVLPIPPPLATALEELRGKLHELAVAAERAAPGRIPRTSRLLEDDAPLFPAVARWGCAASSQRAEREDGLSRSAVAMMLRRRAERAGITSVPGSEEFRRVHPHGFRAMALTLAMLRGTPANVVQAIAGHSNLATTGRYTDALAVQSLVLHQTPAQAGAPPMGSARVAYGPPYAASAAPTADSPTATAPPPYRPPPAAAPARKKPTVVIETTATVEEVPEPPKPVTPPPALAQTPAVQVFELDEDDDEPLPAVALEEGDQIVVVGECSPLPRPLPSAVELAKHGALDDDEDEDDEGVEPPPAGLPQMTPSQREQLDSVYRSDRWGERPSSGGPKPDFLHARKTGNQALGIEPEADALTQVSVSSRTNLPWFWGDSGKLEPAMPVMYGPDAFGDGQLFSVFETYETPPDTTIAKELDRLWHRWMENGDGNRGPTAAKALMLWLGRAMSVSQQVAVALVERQTTWFQHYAVVPAGSKAFREHRNDMVVRWFESRAWTYAPSRGREGRTDESSRVQKVVDSKDYPAWYADPDPILSLPPDEREELIDLIDAIVGREPRGTTLRYTRPGSLQPDLRRADLTRLISALCGYDNARERIGDAKAKKDTVTVDVAKQAALIAEVSAQRALAETVLGKAAARAATRTDKAPRTGSQLARWRLYAGLRVGELAGKLASTKKGVAAATTAIESAERAGAADLPRDLYEPIAKLDTTLHVTWIDADVPSVREFVEKRVQVVRAQAQLPDAAKKKAPLRKERRDASYARLLGTLFGDAAASDRVLAIAAYCGGYPPSRASIAGARYADFFNFDNDTGTIQHTDAFKADFAQKVGAHSECVARRVARHLWELKKGGDARLLFGRHTELIEQLDAWAYIRASCPPSIESDLRAQLGPRATFEEALDAAVGSRGGTAMEEAIDRLSPAELAKLEEGFGESPMGQEQVFVVPRDYERNPSRFYLTNASQRVPSPVTILVWGFMVVGTTV